jgi:hypothetical protein
MIPDALLPLMQRQPYRVVFSTVLAGYPLTISQVVEAISASDARAELLRRPEFRSVEIIRIDPLFETPW